MKPTTRRAQQAELTKQKIYETAITLFKNYRYEEVNVAQIAKEAGVSVGSFYHYYQSKLELFMKIFVNVEDYLKAFENIDLETSDPKEIILKYFHEYAILNRAAGSEIVQGLANPENRKILEKNQDFENILKSIIEYYQEHHRITSKYSSKEICDDLFIISRGVVFDWCIHCEGYELVEKMETFISKVITLYLI